MTFGDCDGHFSLFEASFCDDLGDRTEFSPSSMCVSYSLASGPKRLDYMRDAGAAAFSFTLFAFLTGLFAAYLTWKHAKGKIDKIWRRLPHGCQSKFVCTGFHVATAFFAFLAWTIYAGVVNNNNDDEIKKCTRVFGGGFVFVLFCTYSITKSG